MAGRGVATASGGVLVLVLEQFPGRSLQTLVSVSPRQRQSVDQRVDGGANLAQGDLWVFPPATAPFGGPGINDSLVSPQDAS